MEVYYIDTIEQTKKDGGINEYGKREQHKDLTWEGVLAKFFKKLSDVSADIGEGKNHYFMDIRISDKKGNTLKKEEVGEYQEQPSQNQNQESEVEA